MLGFLVSTVCHVQFNGEFGVDKPAIAASSPKAELPGFRALGLGFRA